MLNQVFARRSIPLDRARRRNVVSCDAVSQDCQHASAFNLLYRRGLGGHAVKIWSLADIGRVRLPLILVAGGELEVLPVLITIRNSCVFFGEDLGIDR